MKTFLLLLMAVLTSSTVFAQEYEDNNGLIYSYYSSPSNGAKVTGTGQNFDGSVTNVEIPASINVEGTDYTVESIDNNAFSGKNNIEHLKLSEGITTLGSKAFYNCKNLKFVELPSTLVSIANDAFLGCEHLAHIGWSVDNPETINPSFLPSNVFMTLYVPSSSQNAYLSNVVWTTIFKDRIYGGNMKFVSNDNMKYVCAEDTHEATLYQGKNVSEVIVPTSFTEGGISYTVKGIGRGAFYNDTSIKSVLVETGVTTIGINVFQKCSNLKKVVLPSTLIDLGANSFYECSSLTYFGLGVSGSNVAALNDAISAALHLSTTKIKYLYVPDVSDYYHTNWTDCFSNIFEGAIEEVENDGMKYVCASESGEAILSVGKNDTEVIIPENFGTNNKYKVIAIDKNAFNTFTSVQKIVLPSTLREIGNKAFSSCVNLAHVSCKVGDPSSMIVATDAFPSGTKTLYVPSLKTTVYSDVIVWKDNFATIYEGEMVEFSASGMKYIGASVSRKATLINGDKNSADIIVGESVSDTNSNLYTVEAIDRSAFKNCTNLTTLAIGSTVKRIGKDAFSGCAKMRKLELPSNLEIIEGNAFYNCSKLEIIVCHSSNPKTVDATSFPSGVKNSATLFVPIGSTNAYQTATNWNFGKIVEGEGVTEVIQEGMTYVCMTDGSLNVATLTKGVSSENITIPNAIEVNGESYQVTAIADKAFNNITALVSLTLSDGISGIKTIGANAFQGCSSLQKVVLPSTLISIGSYAFDKCGKLSYIVSKITTPFDIEGTVFSNTDATLYVPATKRDYYKERSGWSQFGDILEGDLLEVIDDNTTYYCATYDKVATLIKSNSTKDIVVIPQYILVDNTSYNVTTIEKSAFSGKTSLVNLTISEGVNTIKANAFQKCTNLQTIDLPYTLCAIGDLAFDQCTKINTITSRIRSTGVYKVFNINDNVFPSGIWPTATVYVPIGAMEIYKKTEGWKNFVNFIEGEKLQATVDNMTYVYLTGPKTATLISTTTTDKAVTIPGTFKTGDVTYTVTAIENSAFKGITSIENLKISENIKTIGAYAFQGCSKLKKIELPSTLSAIGDYAFDGCKVVTHLCSKVKVPFTFNTNVFPIYSATTLFVPKGTKDKYKMEGGWNNYMNVVEGYLVDVLTQDGMTYDCLKNGEGESVATTAILTKSATTTADVSIPSSIELDNVAYKVTTIGKSAFIGNSKLVNLTIPEYVDSIGESAFDNCNYIENIISQIEKPFSINNNVFSNSSATLYVPVGTRDAYKTKDGWSKFTTVYEGLMKEKTINDMSYVYATGDKTAILVSTTTTAADVIIPDSFAVDDIFYKVIAINKAVFKGKTSIVNLTLPLKMKQIGDNAFDGCKNIATIVSKAIEPIAISENVFPAYTAVLYVPTDSRAKYQNATGWKNFGVIYEGVWKEVTFEDGMTYIYATGDKTATLIKTTSSEKDITIPGSFVVDNVTYKVTSIKNSVFKSNTSVVNLKISENIKTIGAYAFQGCSNLKKLELPSTLTDIGEKAFDGCKKLTHICSKVKAPFDIDDNVFSINTSYLYVPDGTLGSYQARNGWSRFTNVFVGLFVDELVSDGMTFVCLKNGEGNSVTTTAILTKSATTASNVSIPSTLELDQVSYKVTTIGKSAFSGNSKLVNLTLSENIMAIEENAFSNCNSIVKITSMIKEPFDMSDNVFSAYTATLCVPEKTRTKYKASKGWQNFTTILEGEMNETTTDDGFTYSYVTGDKTATLIKAAVSNKDIVIPGTFKLGEVSYTVTAISNAVFKNNKTVVNLKISENIQFIGANAFQNCVNLEKIELPSTLVAIEENAFADCTRLSHIVIKVNPPFSINDNVFSESIYPSAILYVPQVSSADYKTTAGWQNFTHILVGELNEVTIDDLTYYCVSGANVATLVKASTSIADVTIPATIKVGDVTYNVTDIGAYAFSGVSSLEKVTISEGVLNLGIGAFQNCNKLNEVVLPSSITSISELAFDKCSRLALVVSHIKNPFAINENVFPANTPKLNIPEGTTDLYRSAGGWTNFALLVEGDMLEIEIDGMTYLYITGPRTATLVKGVTSLSDLTIPATITVEGVEYAVTAIGESALVNSNSIVNLTVSEGIKTIEANAFKNSQYMNKVELPSTLTVIGDNAFAKCDRLTHVVSSIKKPFDISENVFSATTFANATLYIPEKTSELYQATDYWNKFQSVLEGDILEETIDGMTYIYIPNLKIAKLTKGSTGVKEVTIPATVTIDGVEYQVTSIDRSAFYGNNSIVSLTVSEGVMNIGYTAFKNCYNLKTVSLPESMVSIADYAFENCSRLTTFNSLSSKPIDISSNVFSVSTMTVNVPAGSADLYKADENWGKFDIAEINSISISAANQVPYYSNYNLDFTNKPDLKAYVATGYDKSTGTIWLTRVKQVPANIGFLLIGDAGDYDIPVINGVSDVYYKNMFKGTLEGTTIHTTDGKYTNYYLSNGTSGVGFYKVTKAEGVKVGANRCYLPILTDIPANGDEGDSEMIKVTAAKQVPYYTSKNLDFTTLETQGVKAYTATGYNYSTGVIWLTRVKKVPAKTGILVMVNEAGEYNVPTASVQSTYENMFVGSLTAQTIYTNETIDGVDYVNYYLSNGASGVGFYKVTNEDGVKMGANRCYLPIPKRDAASGARGKSGESSFCQMVLSDESNDDVIAIPVFGGLDGEDDGTTGIEVHPQSSIFNDQSNDVYYNLQGQRVEHPGKGLYIKNGKKVMIK